MGVGRKFVPETGNLSSLYLPRVACVRVCGIICMLPMFPSVHIYTTSSPFSKLAFSNHGRSKQADPSRLRFSARTSRASSRASFFRHLHNAPTKVAGYRTGTFFRKSGQQRRVLATTSYNNCNRSIIDTSHTPCRKEDIFLKDTHSPPTPYPPAPLDLSVPWSQLDTLLFHR